MTRESVGERAENFQGMLRMHCLKILEGVWILECIVLLQSVCVGVTVDSRLAHSATG